MRPRFIASVLGLALVAGCATPGYKEAGKTNSSLSDVKSELISDKTNLMTTVNDLNDLVYNPKTDLRPQYDKFASDVTSLQKSVETSRASAKGMVANRENYLSKWRNDTAAEKDADLRARAMKRITEVEGQFGGLSTKLLDADAALSPLVEKLASLKTVLGNDLTAANIKLVSDRATAAKNESITVNGKIDAAITEVDKVSNQIAPMAATPGM